MKRTASFILAIVMLFSTLLCGTALAAQQKMAQSSTKSTTGVELQYPAEGDYFQDPVLATAKASQRGGRIYLMPKPQAGNGNLGLVDDGTEVIILAESRGFYFFDAGDGRVGWNGKKYFTLAATPKKVETYSTVSTTGVALEWPKDSEYIGEELIAYAKPENKGGSIYIMPKPKAGNGNLGTIAEGTQVTILAQRGNFYFFETEDGRAGWNGKKYFSLTEISTGAYSSVSTTGVALEMPKASEYYGEEILASAKPENRGGFIYIMPKPKAGNGNLGTVDEGTVVTILAQRGSYYFFETDDGRMGWNGKKYFSFD